VTDAITLTIPRDRPFYGVARLVVGGLAARLQLSYEHLEDLQVALESVLGNDAYAVGDDVTVELAVGPEVVRMLVGPVTGAELRADLEREGDAGGIGLSRLLRTVVEAVDVQQRDGGEWLLLEKRVPGGIAAA
jgi:anti-sigma regulatory factor (Ser/Thr protein kinase)